MRKLLGYRLKSDKEDYRDAVRKITGSSMQGWDYKGIKYDFLEESNACKSISKAGVMHWFEEVYEEEKLEVGKWYKKEWNDGDIDMFYAKRIVGDFVFDDGNYFSNGESVISNEKALDLGKNDDRFKLKPATTEEIQQALIKEAKKRGFKEGSLYQCCKYNQINTEPLRFDKLFFRANTLTDGYGNVVFYKGDWSKILPDNSLNGKTAIIDGVEYELKLK